LRTGKAAASVPKQTSSSSRYLSIHPHAAANTTRLEKTNSIYPYFFTDSTTNTASNEPKPKITGTRTRNKENKNAHTNTLTSWNRVPQTGIP
jgi:hypothetical protein